MARRGWWKRDSNARRGDGCKRRDARWPRGRRLTVALPLDIVGELHRQRSKSSVRTTAKSRILDRLTASPERAIQRRHVGTSQIRRKPTRTMRPGRSRDYGLYRRVGGTHIGQPSTNIDPRAPDVLDPPRVDEPTRTESRSASPTSGGAIGVNAAHVTPSKIRLTETDRGLCGWS